MRIHMHEKALFNLTGHPQRVAQFKADPDLAQRLCADGDEIRTA